MYRITGHYPSFSDPVSIPLALFPAAADRLPQPLGAYLIRATPSVHS